MEVRLFVLLLLLLSVGQASSSFGSREAHYGGFADAEFEGSQAGVEEYGFSSVPSDDSGFSSGGTEDYHVSFDPDIAVGLVFTGSLEVSSISPRSAADLSRVVVGDYLLKVDDIDVDGRSLKQVFSLIREAACRPHGFSACFRPASSPRRLPQASLEYEVSFDLDGSLGIDLERSGAGIRVTAVRDGQALQSGEVVAGDVLLSVNGTAVESKTLDAVVEMVKAAPLPKKMRFSAAATPTKVVHDFNVSFDTDSPLGIELDDAGRITGFKCESSKYSVRDGTPCPARDSGVLFPGDRIMQINGKRAGRDGTFEILNKQMESEKLVCEAEVYCSMQPIFQGEWRRVLTVRAATAATRDLNALARRRMAKKERHYRRASHKRKMAAGRRIGLQKRELTVAEAMLDAAAIAKASLWGPEKSFLVFAAPNQGNVLERRFEVPMVLAEFSSNLSSLVEEGLFPITYAEPADACAAIENAPEVQGAIVLARRGRCTFLEKAHNLFQNGAEAVLVVNGAGGAELIAMPGGADLTAPMKIPVAMISSEDGIAIESALKLAPLHGGFK